MRFPHHKHLVGLSEAQRFWLRVERTASCWLWRGRVNPANGQALWHRQRPENTTVPAYRWVMEQLVGRRLDRLEVVCHKCDNPGCVRPDHLFLGTHRDNHMDKLSKNRQARGRCQPYPGVVRWHGRKRQDGSAPNLTKVWQARISAGHKLRSLGYYATVEEAILARQMAEAEREDRWRAHMKAVAP